MNRWYITIKNNNYGKNMAGLIVYLILFTLSNIKRDPVCPAVLYISNSSSGATVAFRQLYKSQNTYSRLSFWEIKCILSYQQLLWRTYSKKYPQLLMQALLTRDQTGQRLQRLARHNPRRCICAWETGGERGKNGMKAEGRTGCRQQWSGCFLTVTEHRKCTMMWTVTLEFLQR